MERRGLFYQFMDIVTARRGIKSLEVAAAKAASIDSWENDRELNPEGLVVVRGMHETPVELKIRYEGMLASFVVNGRRYAYPLYSPEEMNNALAAAGLLRSYENVDLRSLPYQINGRNREMTVLTGHRRVAPPTSI